MPQLSFAQTNFQPSSPSWALEAANALWEKKSKDGMRAYKKEERK